MKVRNDETSSASGIIASHEDTLRPTSLLRRCPGQAASRRGWVTARVAFSIPWPQDDVLVEYDGIEYFPHGTRQGGERRLRPRICTPADRDGIQTSAEHYSARNNGSVGHMPGYS